MSSNSTVTEVPFLDLNAQFDKIRNEVKEAINRVLESQYFILGPEVESFEEDMADYCDVENAIGCASGSDALLLSLMALDVGPGDAVITSPFTFFATAGAIARLGATPLFLDVDPVSYNLDPGQVRKFLQNNHPLNDKIDVDPNNVKAVIPVHLYGQMADMDAFVELKEEFDVSIIEDAAQAIGSEYKGKRAGSIGDFGCFSFFPSKNLGGYGDGGLVTTNDDKLAEKVRTLRVHGAKPKYHHSLVGINSRLDALQAAVLKVKLKYLDKWSHERRRKALNYRNHFDEAGLTDSNKNTGELADCLGVTNGESDNRSGDKLILPIEYWGDPQRGGRHIYHQFVIRVEKREEIKRAFDKKNIGYSVYYPVPLHEQECFKYLGYESSDCPVASHCSKTTLALPIYPEITDDMQKFVVETIAQVLS